MIIEKDKSARNHARGKWKYNQISACKAHLLKTICSAPKQKTVIIFSNTYKQAVKFNEFHCLQKS